MQLPEFVSMVDTVFPFTYAVEGDNVGLQIASRRSKATKVLVCLEINELVVSEAIEIGADVILTFHPLIYTPLLAIDGSERVTQLTLQLISADIAVVCVHTAFDMFPQGTNHLLAGMLGLETIGPLTSNPQPAMQTNLGSPMLGILAKTATPIEYGNFVATLASVCNGVVRHVPPSKKFVELVAIVSGSGMSRYTEAVASGADLFLTADVKYHSFHAARGIIGLADVGHFEMEQFVPNGICTALRSRCSHVGIEYSTSKVNTNPVQTTVPIQFEN